MRETFSFSMLSRMRPYCFCFDQFQASPAQALRPFTSSPLSFFIGDNVSNGSIEELSLRGLIEWSLISTCIRLGLRIKSFQVLFLHQFQLQQCLALGFLLRPFIFQLFLDLGLGFFSLFLLNFLRFFEVKLVANFSSWSRARSQGFYLYQSPLSNLTNLFRIPFCFFPPCISFLLPGFLLLLSLRGRHI